MTLIDDGHDIAVCVNNSHKIVKGHPVGKIYNPGLDKNFSFPFYAFCQ